MLQGGDLHLTVNPHMDPPLDGLLKRVPGSILLYIYIYKSMCEVQPVCSSHDVFVLTFRAKADPEPWQLEVCVEK